MDLVGPLPPSEGHSYIFTIVDRFSRWPEAIPLRDSTAKSCVQALLRTWVTRFGVPDHIISDRGAQFTGALWHELHHLLGIHVHQTTSYHPQANGLVERFHRQLKGALRARLTGPEWMDHLPVVLLGIRTAWREDAGASPAELLYGAALRLPGEMIPDVHPLKEPDSGFLRELQRSMRLQSAPLPRFQPGRSFVPRALDTAEAVYLRHDARKPPLQRPYDGPYRVLKRGPKAFTIICNGREVSVSVDRLKPACTPDTAPPPQPVPTPPDPDLEAPLRPLTTCLLYTSDAADE